MVKVARTATVKVARTAKVVKAEKTVTTTSRLFDAPYPFASANVARTPSPSRVTSLPGMMKR